MDALTEHYSSPGRLADYQRRFERVDICGRVRDVGHEGLWGFESVGMSAAGPGSVYSRTSGLYIPSTSG